MQLRFSAEIVVPADPVGVLVRSGFRCNWCDFVSEHGQTAYVESDGVSCVACSVCLEARHVTVATGRVEYPARLIWAPDIAQPALSHFMRVVALSTRLSGERPTEPSALPSYYPRKAERPSGFSADPRLDRNLTAIRTEIDRRKRMIDAMFRQDGQGRMQLAQIWDELDDVLQESLLKGLRIVPSAFSKTTVARWADADSSLNGYGSAFLDKSGWFMSEFSDPFGMRNDRMAS